MRRGEVWWADLASPAGRRPVLLLSRDEAYLYRDLVIISPLATRIRGIPTEVQLGPEEGLPRASVVNLDVLLTIPKDSLQERIALLGIEKRKAVEEALHFALGLEA